MKIFALDISTKTGWSYFIDGKLVSYGLVTMKKRPKDYGKYPENFVEFAQEMATRIKAKMNEVVAGDFWDDGMIVIEETTPGRATYPQKILEFIHCLFIRPFVGKGYEIRYVRTGCWRKTVDLRMTKEDKAQNKLVKMKKARGKVTPKHLSVRMVNERFGLKLKLKDNDISDAILIGASAYMEVTYTEGT